MPRRAFTGGGAQIATLPSGVGRQSGDLRPPAGKRASWHEPCWQLAEVCRASRGETSQVCAPPGESGSNTRDESCAGASARRQAADHCLPGRGGAGARHRPVPAEPPPKARRGVNSEARRGPTISCGGRARNGTAVPCLGLVRVPGPVSGSRRPPPGWTWAAPRPVSLESPLPCNWILFPNAVKII